MEQTPTEANILISGAGGGFDFLCGLPLAYELKQQGHTVVFSNYSFTDLRLLKGEQSAENLYRITTKSALEGNATYFPEGLFAQWYLQEYGAEVPFYCYKNIGVLPLKIIFNTIRKLHDINVIIVMDGGVDGIFKGNEYGLGTPSIDSVSMIAANESLISEKYYVITAFGSEGVGDEISHAEALQRISDLSTKDAYYGVSALLKNTPAAQALIKASEFVFSQMPKHQHSNIICSILKALNGKFGFCKVNEKTENDPIWLSVLTSMYWFFDLDSTAKMKLFYSESLNTSTVAALSDLIEQCRGDTTKARPCIPI